MNLPSEQIRADLSLDIALDQPLTSDAIIDTLQNCLGRNNCSLENIANKKTFVYNSPRGVKEILLFAAITYLGGNGQHAIFKKRIQLQKVFKEIYNEVKDNKEYNVRFIGVYHYNKNIIFADFLKETYLKKKMNNSAAHIYINDLFQAMKNGIFEKIDNFGNKIVTIRYGKFKAYLNNEIETKNELFNIFESFNQEFKFNNWVNAQNAILEMYKNNWPQWKQTEWAGWYVEFKIDSFIQKNNLSAIIKYVGNKQKGKNELDFDLWFDKDKFYGDLKASDTGYEVSPGNDKDAFLECVNQFDKFWYIIYEHNTIKDTSRNFEATKFRANFIKNNGYWDKGKQFDEMSYSARMKNQVKFVNMIIIELNRINFREALIDFNQGRQPNGSTRKSKFAINKKNIDNFVVYRYRGTNNAKEI